MLLNFHIQLLLEIYSPLWNLALGHDIQPDAGRSVSEGQERREEPGDSQG
mgnify:CR=1 FL=1